MAQTFILNSHIHFGAIVYVQQFMQDRKRFFYSDGMVCHNILSIIQNQIPVDPSLCLFKILPGFKSQAEQGIKELLGIEKEDIQPEIGERINQKKFKKILDQFDFQVKHNSQIKEKVGKTPLKYYENFILQHVYSSRFLSIKKEQENKKYSLFLAEYPSSLCIFNLKPCYNYQKDYNIYVPFDSAMQLVFKSEQNRLISQLSLKHTEHQFSPWEFTIETGKGSARIKFNLYQTAQELMKNYLSYLEPVSFFHLESDSFLNLISDNHKKKFLLIYKIEHILQDQKEQKNSKYQNQQDQKKEEKSFSIFLQKSNKKTSDQRFSLWKIVPVKKSENLSIGGRVKFDEKVQIYNIKYKCLLSIKKKRRGRNKYQYQYQLEQSSNQSTIFRVKGFNGNKYVSFEDLFIFQHVETQKYITLNNKFKSGETKSIVTPALSYKMQDNFKMEKMIK